ncbi:MAG: histidine kinase, partial [Deltaproteobacteria bacterium]|nr:histidine kinase [Deltaproteobacteria bacterium]
SLQSDKIRDQQHADMFRESQESIRAMALIHEKLYRSRDLARVDFNEYIKSLINSLFRSHGIDTGRIVMKVKVEDVSLGIDHAIPCGLVINELVSNALKYAFPEDRKGEISVTLRSISEDEIELRVSDDGVGIPEDMDIGSTDSLGLEWV